MNSPLLDTEPESIWLRLSVKNNPDSFAFSTYLSLCHMVLIMKKENISNAFAQSN